MLAKRVGGADEGVFYNSEESEDGTYLEGVICVPGDGINQHDHRLRTA